MRTRVKEIISYIKHGCDMVYMLEAVGYISLSSSVRYKATQ